MSQSKPEVGDIWISNEANFFRIILEFEVQTFTGKELRYQIIYKLGNRFVIDEITLKDFEECNYIDKAKVSIKELFDVAD